MNLKKYLDNNNIKYRGFAESLKIHENTIYNIVKGKNASYEVALMIIKATRGKVKMKDLIKKEEVKKIVHKDFPPQHPVS